MLKKTKNVYKNIAEKINEVLEYNKNVNDGFTAINTYCPKISKGLYNCGADKIFNELCQEMNYTNSTAPFYVELYDNEDYYQMFIKFGNKPRRYGMEH